ncbi:MAG: phytoene desaturase family protein [Dongiaceae bacterium]
MAERVVIIGAGPGGLAAAMLLARCGVPVTVLERLDRVGGRSGSLRADGFTFDTGATFFLYPRVLEEIFAACGRELGREVPLLRLDPLYRLVFEGGGELSVTADPPAMEAAIARLAPGDAPGYRRFMADNRRKLAAFRPIFETPFASPAAVLRPSMLKALPLMRPGSTVDADLGRYFADPRIRLAFSFQSKYLGMSPFQCPSLFTILAFMEHEYGVFHPQGGCGAVMERMAEVARELGAEIRLGEPVEEILFEGRRAVGVRTPQATYRSSAMVINADFAQSMRRLVPDRLRRRWTDRRIGEKKFSCSTFMMYLGLEGRLDHLAHHTILLARDYMGNVAAIDAGGPPPQEPSLYVQNACVTEPGLAPPGCSTLYVLVPVANHDGRVDWKGIKPAYRRTVLQRLAALGIEDIERRIRFERIVTPVDWRDDLAIHRGATFNLAHSLDQMLHRRPRNRFEDLDGVYLVGGGTHPGSGLPVIFESARIATRLLQADLGLRPAAEAAARPAPAPPLAGHLGEPA